MRLHTEKGSVAVESTVTLLVFSTIISSGFAVLYVSFARVWLDRQVYETLICLASTARTHSCERALRQRVELALPIGELRRVDVSRTSRRVDVRLGFHLRDFKLIDLEDSRRLPLLTGARR